MELKNAPALITKNLTHLVAEHASSKVQCRRLLLEEFGRVSLNFPGCNSELAGTMPRLPAKELDKEQEV